MTLVDGAVYEIRSRNLLVGIWRAESQSFLGIREKFGTRYLFAEYYYDNDIGSPLNTARPVRRLDVAVPEGISNQGLLESNRALLEWLEDPTKQVLQALVLQDKRDDQRYLEWQSTHPHAVTASLFRSKSRSRKILLRMGRRPRMKHGMTKHARDQMRYHEKQAVKEYKMAEEATYRIVRFYEHHGSEVLKTGLSLGEAKAHCNDPESSSATASRETLQGVKKPGDWFDGFTRED